jgi:hypothetical protein
MICVIGMRGQCLGVDKTRSHKDACAKRSEDVNAVLSSS